MRQVDDRLRARRAARRTRAARVAAALACTGALLQAAACADFGHSMQQLGLPFTSFTWRVARLATRGPYLDASLARESGVTSRVFTLDTPECRTVLAPEAEIEWKESGPAGRFAREDLRCEGAGVSDLGDRRRPRPIGQLAPSALATFAPIHLDEETIFLRGRFPLGYTVGWPADRDCVAVLPNTQACREATRSGSATLQYWPSDESVLRLMSEAPGGCPVLALLGPPGHPRP